LSKKQDLLYLKRVEQEKKQKLMKIFNDSVAKLKSISKDAHFTDTIIEKIVSTQKEMDLESTLVYIPLNEMEKEYDFEYFKIIKTKSAIIYNMTGYIQIIYPYCRSLYGMWEYILDLKDKYDSSDIETRELYDTLFYGANAIMMNPSYAFTDNELFEKLAINISEIQNEYFKKLLKKSESELKDENPDKNDSFNDTVNVLEELKNEGEDKD
jgi:hypothetical protein